MSQAPDQPQGHSARAPESDSPSSLAAPGLQAGAGAPPAAAAASQAQTPASRWRRAPARSLQQQLQRHIQHVVVIYLENRSFNNLFADFPGAGALVQPAARALCAARPQWQPLPSLPKVWGGMVPRSQSLAARPT
jgi:acid phosphatase